MPRRMSRTRKGGALRLAGGRRRRRSQGGRGLIDFVKKAFGFAKKHKILSKGLKLFGRDKLAGLAGSVGMGRKRRCARRCRRV